MKRPSAAPLKGTELVDYIVEKAQEKKAENIVIINLSEYSGIADFFIICEGDNTVHTKAIADIIVEKLSLQKTEPWHIEGHEEGRWILIDYSDIIVHVMIPELRDYYQLDKLWEHKPSLEQPTNII